MASAPPEMQLPPQPETLGNTQLGAARFTGGTAPVDVTWEEAVIMQVKSSAAWLTGAEFLNDVGPADPNFTVDRARLRGYEDYARDLMDSVNETDFNYRIEEIERQQLARAAAEQELTLLESLATEFANPINYIPIPFIAGAKGLGILRGALRGGTALGGALAAEEIVRGELDPTVTYQETLMGIAFGGLMGGAFGSVLGATGARASARWARVAGLENMRRAGTISDEGFVNAMAKLTDEDLGPEPVFRAEPTSGAVGVAKAFGLENQTRMTVWGKLKALGVGAAADFADIMLGDFNVMAAQNMKGTATPQSVKLNTDVLWKAPAYGVTESLQKIYGKMARNGKEGRTILGADVETTKQKLKEGIGRGGRADNLPQFREWKREVFRAYLKGDSTDPFVVEAVNEVRKFFNMAESRMKESGTIRTRKNWQERSQRKLKAYVDAVDGLARATTESERVALTRKLNNAVAALGRMADESMERAGFGDVMAEADKLMSRNGWYSSDAVQTRINYDTALMDVLNEKMAKGGSLSPDEADLFADLLNGLERAEGTMYPRSVGDDVPPETLELGAEAALNYIANNSQNPEFKEIARNLQVILRDVPIRMKSFNSGDEYVAWLKAFAPVDDASAARLKKSFESSSALFVNETSGKAGYIALRNASRYARSEDVVLHELIHAALWAKIGDIKDWKSSKGWTPEQRIRVGEAVTKLEELQARATQAAKGKKKYARFFGESSPLDDIDEFITWGLTDKDFGDFLDTLHPSSAEPKSKAEKKGFKHWIGKLVGAVLGAKNDFAAREIMRTARSELREVSLELFDELGGVKTTAADRGKFLDGLQPKAEGNYLDVLAERSQKYYQDRPDKMGGEAYLPRFWLIDKILEDEAGPKLLRRKLERHYANGGPITPDIERRVTRSIERITRVSELGEMQLLAPNRGVLATFMRSREIDIPNSMVMDFIETDMDKIMASYAERAGTIDEITRIFGDPDAQGAIDDVLVQAAREGMGLEELRDLAKQLELARDKRTDAVYKMEPELVSRRRLASAIGAYGQVLYLGKAALSAIPEISRMLMVNGFARTFEAIAQHSFSNKAFKESWDRLPAITSKGLDSLHGTVANRFVEQGGPTGAATTGVGRLAQRGVDFAQGPGFLVNLLAPMTDMTKRMTQTFTHQFMLEDVAKLASGTGDKKLAQRLASYGIDLEMAERIAKQPWEKSDDWYLPNMAEWPDQEAARAFSSAVAGMVDNIVPTAGLADIPEIAKGFVAGREYPLIKLPFQFMSYGFSVANRVLLSSLQGRDASAMMGIAAMIGLGYLSQKLKTDEGYWNSMGGLERTVRAVDAAGIAGMYSDLNTTLEMVSDNSIGVRPALGLRPFGGDKSAMETIGEFGGPAGGMAIDVARLIADPDMNEQESSAAVRGLLPWNRVFYLDGLFDGIQGGAQDLMGSPDSDIDNAQGGVE